MADNANNVGLERTMMDLMETQQKNGIDQTNMLLMLSLVNLMGIVNILQQSTGVNNLADSKIIQGQVPVASQGAHDQGDLMHLLNQAATGQLDPMQLLTMLNGSGKGMPNPAALMGLLSQMMPPPPPAPQHQAGQFTKAPINEPTNEPTATEVNSPPMENYSPKEPAKERERERINQKNFLKWDPRLG